MERVEKVVTERCVITQLIMMENYNILSSFLMLLQNNRFAEGKSPDQTAKSADFVKSANFNP